MGTNCVSHRNDDRQKRKNMKVRVRKSEEKGNETKREAQGESYVVKCKRV